MHEKFTDMYKNQLAQFEKRLDENFDALRNSVSDVRPKVHELLI